VAGGGCPDWDGNHQVQINYGNFQHCEWTIPAGYAVTTSVGFIESGYDALKYNGDQTRYTGALLSILPVLVGPGRIYFDSDVSVTGSFSLTANVFP
jgi:hypothetical protein